jgi:carbonic anhydrase
MVEQREIVWQQRQPGDPAPAQPSSPAAARALLQEGNADFAAVGEHGGRHAVAVGPEAFGLPRAGRDDLAQEPFAAILSCADARVPVELICNQGSNALFVVRVAGNVPGQECVGSLNYAVANLPSVQLITVVGHTECGAVSAAVDALLSPQTYLHVVHDPALRAIVDALLAGVWMADNALTAAHGRDVRDSPAYRRALIEVAVIANTAITASVLDGAIDTEVTYAIFDLDRRTLGSPGAQGWSVGLHDSPGDDQLAQLLQLAAAAIDI